MERETKQFIESIVTTYPHVVITMPFNKFTAGDRFFSSSNNKMYDVFTDYTLGDQSPFGLNDWSDTPGIKTTSAAKNLAELLMHDTAISTTVCKFFKHLEVFEPIEIADLLGADWQTRRIDLTSQYELAGAAYANLWAAVFCLITLRNKYRIWHAQVQEVKDEKTGEMVYRKVQFIDDKPETWLPKLYQDHYTSVPLTGTDKLTVKELIQEIEEYKLEFPAEVFHIADKISGSIVVEQMLENGDIQNKGQTIDMIFIDASMSQSPKLTATEDTNLLSFLRNLSYFFKRLPIYTKYVKYGSDETKEKFLKKYTVEPVTYSWLTTWPVMDIPWPLFWFRTHYCSTDTQWEIASLDLSSDLLITRDALHRIVSVKTDNGKWLNFRIPANMSEDKALKAIITGYYIVYGILLPHGDTMDTSKFVHGNDMTTAMRVFQAVEERDNQNQLKDYRAHTTATVLASGLTEDDIVSFWNVTDEAPVDNLTKLQVSDPPTPSVPTSASSTVSVVGNNIVRVSDSGREYVNRRMTGIFYDFLTINRDLTKEFVLQLINPVVAPPQPKAPERSSKLTASTYSSSDDKEELNKLVTDLEGEIKYYREMEQPQQVSNRETTIARIKKHIESIKDKEGSDQGNPAEEKDSEGGPGD